MARVRKGSGVTHCGSGKKRKGSEETRFPPPPPLSASAIFMGWLESGGGWWRGSVGGGGQVRGWKPTAEVGWSRRRGRVWDDL
ncbi:hypothetical protein LINPERPRIM_LOCUS24153 [Linum perenne]